MRVTINHLTKMAPGFVCVAGIEQGTGKHIRPLTNRQLRLEHIESSGGVFGLGAIVDLGRVRVDAKPPEIEDRRCLEHRLSRSGTVGADAFRTLLQSAAQNRLQRIFGPELERIGESCALPKGAGIASLGVLRVPAVDDLIVEQRESVRGRYHTLRLLMSVGRYAFRLPITDLRFARPGENGMSWDIDRDVVDDIRARLMRQSEILLSVGLSRPFQRSVADVPRHWVQVNNIHLDDDPLWRGTLSD